MSCLKYHPLTSRPLTRLLRPATRRPGRTAIPRSMDRDPEVAAADAPDTTCHILGSRQIF